MPVVAKLRDRRRPAALTACVVGCALLAAITASTVFGAGRRTSSAPPTEATYRKLCRAIRVQHVRALFTGPVAPIRLGGSSDCAFFPRGSAAFGSGVQVFLRIDDGDQTLWKHRGDHPYGTFRMLRAGGRPR